MLVSWERLQPRADRPLNWDAPPGGCPRRFRPASWERGLRGLLGAITQPQDADGGWRIVGSPYFTPRWAVRTPAGGQPREGTPVKAQTPRVAAYPPFLRSLQALGDKVGVRLRYRS